MLQTEADLLRAAEDYRNMQQQKQVKNSFSCKGQSQASMEELASILEQRETALKQRSAKQRHVDINRVGVDKSNAPLVSLATTEAVLRGDFPFDAPIIKASTVQDAVAAVSIDAMNVLQNDVTQLFRALLLRTRFERRIALAKSAIANRGRHSEGAVGLSSVAAMCPVSVGALVSLTMVNVASSPTAAATGAFPTYTLKGPHSNYVVEGGSVLEESAPLRKAADFGHFFSDVRQCELAGESSLPKRAKEPLQFKLKSYRFHPSTESSSRLLEPYTFSFPANPLLQAGTSFNEEVQPLNEKTGTTVQEPCTGIAHVPPIEHFVQPLTTLETFPLQQPQITACLSRAPHIEATSLCPQIRHAVSGSTVSASELSIASYQARVANWTSVSRFNTLCSGVSSTLLPRPLNSPQARLKTIPITAPEASRDTLDTFDPLDDLSDSDDEEPASPEGSGGLSFSVGGLLQRRLPHLKEVQTGMTHKTFWVPSPTQN